ncbi:MAG TPA: hypothetical protein VL326_32680 [Kofleriaceae bacterium]|nr:hypothetical protein [Kofleriaceae bacterium]
MTFFRTLGLVVLVGCGSVDSSTKMDAPTQQHGDGSTDSPAGSCTVHDQVTSCGATCEVCGAATDREMATCNGTACGMACAGGNPRCSDNSCSRLAFDFELNIQGTVLVSPSGMTVGRRMHNGSMALAFDFTTNLASTQLEFNVPVCVSGVIDESAKTLKAEVYFEGGTDAGDQYYIQGSVPTPTTGKFLATQSAQHNVTNNYSAPMSASNGSTSFNNITFRIGSFGAAFTGTVWVDNIKVE